MKCSSSQSRNMRKTTYYSIILVLCAQLCQDVSASSVSNSSSLNDGKIVGGYSTTIQKVPYQVFLLLKKGSKYYRCGGSIISKRHVLTAAHCLTGIQTITIRAGSTDSDKGGTMYTTNKFRVHPQYNTKTSDYDVAIVTTTKDIKLDGSSTKAVKLANQGSSVSPGTQILVTGWGATSENGQTSKTLMAVKVPVVSTADCRKSYGNRITARMICAGLPQGGKDSCQGDSGGPAVVDRSGSQVGIVSFGVGCARPKYPGVYTNVANVRAWIKANSGV